LVSKQEEVSLKRSMFASIASDVHFWVPLIVLVLGTLILVVVK